MPKYSAKDSEGNTYKTDTGAESYSNEELEDMLRDWLASPNGRVETSFNMLRQAADPLKGASKVARSLSAGDNPYQGPNDEVMAGRVGMNAAGALGLTAPVWAPAVGAGAGVAARYGIPAAGAAALGHAGLPQWVHDWAMDAILLKMLGRK